MHRTKLNTKGFTIIEVMIVLVIAAVILLIVFLAVPALQRSSRNNDRKNDIQRLAAAYQEFIVLNGGAPPTNTPSDRNELMDLANSNTLDEIRINENNNSVSGAGQTDFAYIRVGDNYSGAKCDGDNAGGANPNAGEIAIVYYIEGFSGRQVQCLDS